MNNYNPDTLWTAERLQNIIPALLQLHLSIIVSGLVCSIHSQNRST